MPALSMLRSTIVFKEFYEGDELDDTILTGGTRNTISFPDPRDAVVNKSTQILNERPDTVEINEPANLYRSPHFCKVAKDVKF